MAENIVQSVIDVLKRRRTPITANELSFKIKTTEHIILQLLRGLQDANIVISDNGFYTLNRKVQEYRPEQLIN